MAHLKILNVAIYGDNKLRRYLDYLFSDFKEQCIEHITEYKHKFYKVNISRGVYDTSTLELKNHIPIHESPDVILVCAKDIVDLVHWQVRLKHPGVEISGQQLALAGHEPGDLDSCLKYLAERAITAQLNREELLQSREANLAIIELPKESDKQIIVGSAQWFFGPAHQQSLAIIPVPSDSDKQIIVRPPQ